jgi:hypothetical protein
MSNKLECRKVRKPKIEKLRRARINTSLESLKDILLRNTISLPQGARPTKLEKADILEMSVRYIELLHEKLSILGEKPTKKSMFIPIKWNQNQIQERAFGDITNETTNKIRQHVIQNQSHLQHRQSSRDLFEKENFNIVTKQENESFLDDHHWRPWW